MKYLFSFKVYIVKHFWLSYLFYLHSALLVRLGCKLIKITLFMNVIYYALNASTSLTYSTIYNIYFSRTVQII